MLSNMRDIVRDAQRSKAMGERSRASLNKFTSGNKADQIGATSVLDNEEILRRWLLIEQGWSPRHELLITVHPTKPNAWIVTVVPKEITQ